MENHFLPFELDVPLAFDCRALLRHRHIVGGEIDLLRGFGRTGPARLSEQRPGREQNEGESQAKRGECFSSVREHEMSKRSAQAKTDRTPLYKGRGD